MSKRGHNCMCKKYFYHDGNLPVLYTCVPLLKIKCLSNFDQLPSFIPEMLLKKM